MDDKKIDHVKLLAVDDEPISLKAVSSALKKGGYEVDEAQDAREALKLISENEYHVVVTDKNMPGHHGESEGGMEIIKYVRDHSPATEVIMLTGHASVESAIEAMKLGAFDYLTKPISKEDLLLKIERILKYKCFINPADIISVYRNLHDEIINLVEKKNELDDQQTHGLLKSINSKIDRFFQVGRF